MTRLGVVFGSRSVEHEVSIISACQLMAAADPQKFQVVPLYIDKRGRWWTGQVLTDIATYKDLDLSAPESDSNLASQISPVNFSPDPTQDHGVDVVISALHGGMGEDGTISGLMALANIPFAAPHVVAAGAAIDKIVTKHLCQAANIPVTPYIWFTREQWQADRSQCIEQAQKLQFPLFVKPAALGSSVGVSRVTTVQELEAAVELAATFDTRLIIEQGAHDCIEVNISVLQTADGPRTSVTEQPIKSADFLSYEDKYGGGASSTSSSASSNGSKSGASKASKGMASLSRRIPAPIAPTLTEKIEAAAKKIWTLIDGSGVARIDFFANPSTEEFFLGELNMPPGSLAFYLWEKTNVPYTEMIDLMVEAALARAAQQAQLSTTFESNILANQVSSGQAGSKR